MTNIAGSGSESGSISQRHGSADPDLDPNPLVRGMYPQHCFQVYLNVPQKDDRPDSIPPRRACLVGSPEGQAGRPQSLAPVAPAANRI
jgi:hypothetical protein